ncbi:MAG: tetratricopeptide repeat protein [Limisphaerales bacterium]
MKNVSPYYWLALLLAACFTLATLFVSRVGWWNNAPRAKDWNGNAASGNAFKMLLGEGRKLFANEFYTMADVYFHSGYYPSMFDEHEADLDVAAGAEGRADDSDSTSDDFLGKPKDWIDALGRNFKPNRHTHLSSGGAAGNMKASSVEEILPWLKLAADLNPQLIETYTVGAYFLRTSLNQPQKAEAFLREGLRNNPDSYQILLALGQIYYEDYHDTNRARNVWELAAKKWMQLNDGEKRKTENKLVLERITTHLGKLEENAGNWQKAIGWFHAAQKVSETPGAIQRQIDEIKMKMVASPAATNAPAR